MRRGERWILTAVGIVVVLSVVRTFWLTDKKLDRGIPFYTTASSEVARKASDLYRRLGCRNCHSLWGVRNVMQAVPAPRLDGIGSLHDEDWFYKYLSASNPQDILPSRLKKQYRMPSYAHLPEEQRRLLAHYLASLKVKDWYLEETRKHEYEMLTGRPYPAEKNNGAKGRNEG